ncbi:hypothetical protein ELD05_11420 [Caldicellulosiruptor changbaiensis]|uniref:Uncharacterized protein n=1 Tax=Caldicellulosiruptor changbaiensis TaxID=1222016 RepID=A0A3T0D8B3_9FIRM|nr:hypothetical protein [Caldicellulosiruptor changbaiensis]AZT91189.1 hypothetical protein ELD05_11420 [Caldicellulosiruptor changbaiensis]
MRKRLVVVLFIFLFLLIGESITYANNSIEITNIEYGIDNKVNLYNLIELKITLQNKSQDYFKGKISVEWWEPKNDAFATPVASRPKEKKFSFSKEFELAANSKKSIILPMCFGDMIYSAIYVKIYNSKGDVILNKQIVPPKKGYNLSIGLLSDQKDKVKYLIKPSQQATSSITVVLLDSSNFPITSSLLERFDTIIIHNYKTSNLSADQYRALKNYIIRGGKLIIFLGENYQKNLSIFKDNFLEGKIMGIKKGDISLNIDEQQVNYTSVEVDKENSEDIVLNDTRFVDFVLKDGEKISQLHIQRKIIGNGVVLVTSFDPFEMDIPAEKRDKLLGFLLQSCYSEYSKFFQGIITNSTSYSYSLGVSNSIYNLAVNVKWPQNGLIIILIVIYIFVISFGNYLILKKFNRRHLTWQFILFGSIVWTGVIFGVANVYKIKQPSITETNFIVYNTDRKGYIANKYYQIFTPLKTNLEIEGANSQKIEPLVKSFKAFVVNRDYANDFEYYPWEKIIFKNVPAFSVKFVRDLETYELPSPLVEMKLNLKDILKPSVEIENKSNYEINHLFVFLSNNMAYVENLKPYAKVVKSFSNIGTDIANGIRNQLYNFNKNRQLNYMYINRLVDLCITSIPENNYSNFYAIGYIRNFNDSQLKVNSKLVKTRGEAIFRVDIKPTWLVDGKMVIPYGIIVPVIIKNTFQNSTSYGPGVQVSYYGKGEIEIEYNVASVLEDVKKVSVRNDSLYGRNNVNEFIYNFKSKKWDRVDLSKAILISESDFGKYLYRGKLRIKVVGFDNSSVASIPLISVEGGGK